MIAHILIIDSVPSANQDLLVAQGGRRQGVNYAAALASQAERLGRAIEATILAAGDGAELPAGRSLADFHGIAWTGAPLNVTADTPEVRRQIALARAVFDSGVPSFGSCWGLQVMVAALGGAVERNPAGPQRGVARAIRLTEAGRGHAMYAGKSDVFDALCIHRDIVTCIPDGADILAANRACAVQGLSVRRGAHSFWGVQYHPEFDLHQVSAMYKRSARRLIETGLARSEAEVLVIADDLKALHEDPTRRDIAWRYGIADDILDANQHRREFANWLGAEVLARVEG